MGTLGRMVPAVPPLTAPQRRGRHCSGHGPQRLVGRVLVHAGVDVRPGVVLKHEGQRRLAGPVCLLVPLALRLLLSFRPFSSRVHRRRRVRPRREGRQRPLVSASAPCRLRRVQPCPQVVGQPGPASARMEIHAVRQPRRTRLTGCHLAPLPPLAHPVLHSFPLGTSPTGLLNPAALRRRLGLRHTPPRVLSPRRNRLRRRPLGPLRPRGDSRERLRYQLAGVSPLRRGFTTPVGCPPVRLQGLREQLADVSRASHYCLLRRIPRSFPRRRPPHGGRALHPTRRGRTTTRHHRLRARRHHGRGLARHGRVRHLDRPLW